MKKTPYRVVVEFTRTCEVLRAAFAPQDQEGKGKCNHIGGVLFLFLTPKGFIGLHRTNKPSFRTHNLIPIVTIYRITIALLMTALVRLAFMYHVTLVDKV